MVVLSVLATAPVAIADDSPTQTVETLENGDDLYLAFGADTGDQSLEEYVDAHLNGDSDATSEVIQYQNVGQVNIHEEGLAVSIAIGGGDATAIQQVDQYNDNVQDGDASAANEQISHETQFDNVGDVYLLMGNGDSQQYDGWAVANGDATVSQTADATVSQAQLVDQTNIVQNATAFAYAENESEATAIQVTEQSNYNLQEGAASAANVYADNASAADPGEHDKQKKQDGQDGADADQSADATVEQAQEVSQANVNQQGTAIAIAVGENASATAIQLTEQSNLNEQVGSAEALNVMLDATGLNIATAGIEDGTDVLAQATEVHDDPEKKSDADAGAVNQTAEASVTQYQSVEQVNINLDSAAQAIATNGSTADAVQLTYQQNVNAQVASAEALNIFIDDSDLDEKERSKLEAACSNYEGVVLTETSVATIGGDSVDDVDRLSFDYDGPHDELNAVEQWSTAEVEQSQNITQVNYQSNTAFAVAEDDGEASAVQITIQENQNVQFAESESATYAEGDTGTDAEKDTKDDANDTDEKKDEPEEEEKKTDTEKDDTITDDEPTDEKKTDDETDADDEYDDDSMPGFGIAVGLVALLVAGALGLRHNR
ncbi:PGF-CTERM sorting domain-containing protein [Natrononativus amylolyticus]|uniref:PGF-CTERM sorting domain-containing protein n=1 Tax=Natrononativus amylolyticus TaxID=2963434 RepID=UPI0031F33035